eukprot:9486790-Pyramimonas_sp.AAC.1
MRSRPLTVGGTPNGVTNRVRDMPDWGWVRRAVAPTETACGLFFGARKRLSGVQRGVRVRHAVAPTET